MIASVVIEWLLMGCAIGVLIVILILAAQLVQATMSGKIDALDLVIGKNGRISDEKIWTHAGKSVLLFAMIKDAADGTPDTNLQTMLFIAIAAHEVFIRWRAHVENPNPTRTPA